MAAGKFISGYDRELHRLLDGVDSRSMACGFGGDHGQCAVSQEHSGRRSMALGGSLSGHDAWSSCKYVGRLDSLQARGDHTGRRDL